MPINTKDIVKNDPASEALYGRVKALRKQHGLTLDQLSAASGVSRSMLSQIERSQASPTLAVISRIAQAFNISVGELVEQPWATSGIEVVHADDPQHLYSADPQCKIRTLSPLHMEKDVEFYELRLAPKASLDSAPHFRGTRELLTVYKGQAVVRSGNDSNKLSPGDSAHYRADRQHSIENAGNGELVCFLVVTYKSG